MQRTRDNVLLHGKAHSREPPIAAVPRQGISYYSLSSDLLLVVSVTDADRDPLWIGKRFA